jgi:hypothetical protein
MDMGDDNDIVIVGGTARGGFGTGSSSWVAALSSWALDDDRRIIGLR